MIDRRGNQLGKVLVCLYVVTIQHRGRAARIITRRKTFFFLMMMMMLFKGIDSDPKKYGFLSLPYPKCKDMPFVFYP